jgi:pyridoxamine 5'-phosphate oxidase
MGPGICYVVCGQEWLLLPYRHAKKRLPATEENPKAELCFYGPDAQDAGRMMRVTGKVEFLEDKSLEEQLYGDRPWLKDALKAAPKDTGLAMFRIAHGNAYFWTRENNMREREAPHLKF